MSFLVNGSPPPFEAMPTWPGPVLNFPSWQVRTLDGRPARAIGFPELRLQREAITPCGLRWWLRLFSGSAAYTWVEIQAFHPYQQAWVSTSGYLWRPTWGEETLGGCILTDFEARYIATCFSGF